MLESTREYDSSSATLDMFSNLNIVQLKDFSLTKKPDLQISKLPKKRKVENAHQGEENLIYVAHSMRSNCIMLIKKLEAMKASDSNEEKKLSSWLEILFNSGAHTSAKKCTSENMQYDTMIND